MDHEARYTSFPNLFDTENGEKVQAAFKSDWPVSLSRKVFILAWASLLQSYTGSAEPIFSVEGKATRVNIQHASWIEVEIKGDDDPKAFHTSLSLNGLSERTAAALSLLYDPQSGDVTLTSFCRIPQSFLPQILCQLQVCVMKKAHLDNTFTTNSPPKLSVVNPRRRILPGPRLLHHLTHAPSSSQIAIDFLSSTKQRIQISYQDLDQISGRLAKRIVSALRTCYEGCDTLLTSSIVLILLPQCPELYASQIAVLKSGAAFCPLNVDVPPERLAFIIKDVAARVVVTTRDCKHLFSGIDYDLVLLMIDEDDEIQAVDSNVYGACEAEQSNESLAYVMYTSGSTGVPKGVGIPHGAVTQAILAHDEHVPFYDRFLQFAAPTFDVSVFEIFFTFYRGATLICCDREDMLNDLPGVMNEMRVDAAEFTPTVVGTLLRSWDAVPCLRLLLTIGEMLPMSVVERFGHDVRRGRILLPMYGPTEASIHCTVAPRVGVESRAAIIGRPLSTVSAFVIDEDQSDEPSLVPIGHVGELAVAGQLAQGYINRSEQTRAVFVTLPGYGTIYRTGDRARLLPSGQFECLGRIASGQVKIRGQRVELGEIEQLVCQVENVRFAIASIINTNLVVFCLLEDDQRSISACRQAIREKCRAWLPPFMRPTDLVLLAEGLPRLPSGKIDKQSLENLYHRQCVHESPEIDDYASDTEKLIAKIIQKELDADIGRYDDLWSKGLDSLRSIRLASKLREEGIMVGAFEILSAETIATLSEFLRQRDSPVSEMFESNDQSISSQETMNDILASELDAAIISEVEDIMPCSSLQLAMLSESLTETRLNFNEVKIEIAKSISFSDFNRAFCELARLNDILRSGFIKSPQQDAQFLRVVWKSLDAKWQFCSEQSSSTAEFVPDEANHVNLLRPLLFKVSESMNNTLVSVWIHHALYDGWSWNIILSDLDLLLSGKDPPERPQFERFVQQERDFLSSKKAAASEEYWKDHLRDIAPIPLPVLTDGKCEKETRVLRRFSRVDLGLLEAASHRLRISRQTIPSASFATLLSFYCGTSEVMFGSVSSRRTLAIAGIENIIGPCISTLPVKINFDKLRTVSDLLMYTHGLHHHFLEFGQLPLRDIKNLTGAAPGQHLFDTLFVWQESLPGGERVESLLTKVDDKDALPYALILELEPGQDQLQLKVTFQTSIISVEQVELFVSQFEACVSFYGSQSSDTPWKEVLGHIRSQDLSIANPIFSKVHPTIDLSSTVDRIVRSDPERIAVEFVTYLDPAHATMKTTKLSYRELSQKAHHVSQYLLSRDVSPDELVCVFMNKCMELYISILGVLKAGAAYLVIDPQAPGERTRRILETANCQYCLTDSEYGNHELVANFQSVLLFDQMTGTVQHNRSTRIAQGTNLAYAVFTSGSTGIPKGVLVTRENIISNIDFLSRIYPFVANGALLQACSPAFDVSVFEILYAWHLGMRLCAASNDVLFRDIELCINLLGITHLSLTPSVAALIRPANVPTVKMLVTAGEAVTSRVFRDWSGRGLYQGYGPSETTNICSVHPDVSPSDHINNVGQPLDNTSWFVSSREAFQPLPKGALGEVWIGGEQVGRGYLNEPKLTAERFINHSNYGRLYKSGDLGRMLPNGSILFYGREDDQVKLRGQRIELREIEHTMLADSAVSDAVCLLIEKSKTVSDRLVAYWSSCQPFNADVTLNTKTIFERLASRLPAYMVPDYLIHVDVLPLTSQGKSDRKALRQLFLNTELSELTKYSRPGESAVDDGLLNLDEMKVAKAVVEVTGAPLHLVGRNTSFFALGLDSINCISLSRKLSKLGFRQVDVSLILRNASLTKLLRVLLAKQEEPMDEETKKLLHHVFDGAWQEIIKSKYAQKGYQVQKILPCTPLQQAMLSQLENGTESAYQNQLTFSVLGNLQKLEEAWKNCVVAHEILRTGFVLTESSQFPFAQIVLADFEPAWNNKVALLRASKMLEQMMMPPYSFAISNQSGVSPPKLTLKIHHALYDAGAVSLLFQDVQRAYKKLPVEAVCSFDPYLEYMCSLDEMRAQKLWQAHLKDYQPKLISAPSLEGSSGSSSEALVSHMYSKVELHTLQESSKQNSVTILSFLQLAWAQLLSHYSSDADICFGNTYSGRNLPIANVEKMIGPCFNTLPTRVRLGKRDTNRQVLRRLHDHGLATLPFQPCSLRTIQRDYGLGSLFDTLLLLQTEPIDLDPSIWTLDEDLGHMDFPLILEVIPRSRSNQINLVIHTARGILSAAGAEAVLRDFDTILQRLLQYPDALVLDESVLGKETPMPIRFVRSSPHAGTPAGLQKQQEIFEKEWSPLERYISEILCKISHTADSEITRSTTIFHLGFDSVSAIQIATQLRNDGYRISSGDVLEAASVRKIASLCGTNASTDLEQGEIFDFDDFSHTHINEVCQRWSIDRLEVEQIRPCTPFQAGILAEFIQSHGEYYLNSVSYELDSNIDFRLLRNAWTNVLSRNEILRTGFVEIDDAQSPFAMVLYDKKRCQLPWSESDLFEENYSELARSVLGSLQQPPWRVVIGNKGTSKIMHLSILHALFDARTLELLLDEVAVAYRGEELPGVLSVKPLLSRILQKSPPKPAGEMSVPSGVDIVPITKFPNLHSHHIEDRGFSTIVYDCTDGLSRLLASCRKAGVTLQAAGQCAWARLLSAYTSEAISTFGVVMTGRSIETGDDKVLFPCINTIPVSLAVESITNRSLLEQAARRIATHLKDPFASTKASAYSFVERYDTLFVLQNDTRSSQSSMWRVLAEDARADYTVSVELLTSPDNQFHSRFTFRNGVIPLQQAQLLAKQYHAILMNTLDHLDDQASAFVHLDIGLISIAPAKEPVIETSVANLHQFVEISSQACPERIAFEFAESVIGEKAVIQSWTYSQLNGEANKVAHLLQQNGASYGDLIGICFDKCPEASFTILGILKAGCAYVAFDPSAPPARKRFILEDSDCRIVCTTTDKVDSLPLVDKVIILRMDELLEKGDLPSSPVTLPRKLVGADICYCLYTSGTTGAPKGCLITHENAVQFILAFQRLFQGHWDVDSRFLQFASFHFDVSVMEQYWSWSIGICVTSAPRDLLFQDLSAAIRALRITHIDLTPSLARLLTPEECPSLCRGAFITGGEQLTQDILDIWGDKQVIYNGYGPSEVTIGCTMYPRVSRSVKPSNIGPAYDNVGAFVLDPRTEHAVLKGAVGELCVSGPLVGKGYLKRPELTDEKFEFVDHLQARIYHTGDLVRLLHDGSFSFIGRIDDQVKLRGQRLEISEINHIIRKTSNSIGEVATMVLRRDEKSKDQLVTFVASAKGRLKNDDATVDCSLASTSLARCIRQACNDALPAYMVPTYIIPVTAMPLSANNKTDHKTLKVLFEATPVNQLQKFSNADVFRRDIDLGTMKRITEVISKVVGIPQDIISASSGLFELGLDSISVISLSRHLKRAGFDTVSPSMVMRTPVVGELVIRLTELQSAVNDDRAARQVAKQEIAAFEKAHRSAIEKFPGFGSHDIEKIAPCTPLQEGMIARSLKSKDPTYFQSFTFALDINVDISRLQAAWLRVEKENEILRTRLIPTSDGYAQVVLKCSARSSSSFQQCATEGEEGYRDASKNDFSKWAAQARRFENRLWAVTVYAVGSRQLLMILNIFHGLYDGISLKLLLEEVACHYSDRPIIHPKPAYHDVLSFGPLLNLPEARDFWVHSLQMISLLNLPLKIDGDEVVTKSLNVASTMNLNKVQLELGVTMAAIFQACWLMALMEQFGFFPTTGVVVSGRAIDVEGIENVVGPLFNTIPCQIDVNVVSCIAELVKACHSFTIETLPYQHTALSKISKWLGRNSAEPLFDSLFVFQREAQALSESSKLWKSLESTSQPDYSLAFEVEQRMDSSFTCTIVARGRYLSNRDVHELLGVFEKTLERLPQDVHSFTKFREESRPTTLEANSMDPSALETVAHRQPIPAERDFQWDATSSLIRSEIANISHSALNDIGPDLSIFELGIDSIDAIKLSARLKAAGISISVSSILQAATVARIANNVSTEEVTQIKKLRLRSSLDQAISDLRRDLEDQGVRLDDYEKVLPVTPLQESMLANYSQYYNQDVLRITEGVDIEKLKTAWHSVVLTHEILRSSFVQIENPRSTSTFAQLVSRDIGFDFSTTTLMDEADLQRLLSTQQTEATLKCARQIAMNLTFARVGSTTFLVLGLPHALYDGWSIDLLHNDVTRCYNGLQCVRPSYEPLLEHVLDAVSNESCSFWKENLIGLHPRSFCEDKDKQLAHSTTNRYELCSDLSAQQAAEFCRAEGVTLQSLALTCWALVLAHYLQTQDVCFGVVLAGRDIVNADEMMFPAMNTVPFRMKVQESKPKTVKEAHNLMLALSEHQHFPLRKAKSLIDGAARPLFDTLFIYQRRPSPTEQPEPLYTSVGGLSEPEYPVNVELELLDDKVVLRTACKNEVLGFQGTQHLIKRVDSVLKSIVMEPSKPTFVSSPDGIVICGMQAFNRWRDERKLNHARMNASEVRVSNQVDLSLKEEIIRQVLADVAKVEREEVQRSTNIYEIGLDSISAIKVSSLLKKQSISLSVSEILKALTLQKMAEVAEPLKNSISKTLVHEAEDSSELLNQSLVQNVLKRARIQQAEVESVLPCTSGQIFLLGMWQASGERLFYPEFHYRMQDSYLSRQSVNMAWGRLVLATPILRTTFLSTSMSDISVLQIILKKVPTWVVWTADRDLPVGNESSLSTSRGRPPVTLFATQTPTGILLKLRIHHALYDGVSMPKMITAFSLLCKNSEISPKLEVKFHTYLQYLQKQTLKAQQKEFWTSYLIEAPMSQLFNAKSFEAKRTELFRPSLIDSLSLIEKKIKETAISFQALFFAAYALVHAKIMRTSPRPSNITSELVVGVYLANRSHDHPDLSELVAPTINIVPLRIPIRDEASLFESARAVQDDLGKIALIEHCTVSLSEMYEWTGVRIDCFVNFLRLPELDAISDPVGGGINVEELEAEGGIQSGIEGFKPPSPFADSVRVKDDGIYLPSIDIEAAIRNGALDVGVFAPDDMLDGQGAENLLEELQAVLRRCASC